MFPFIFQSYNLIDYMTPQENVRLTFKETARSHFWKGWG